jgi:16S rRNA (uracil1498-N3)-methyltransferase
MRLSRLYVNRPLQSGSEAVLDEPAARYVSQVLRLRAGDSVTLFDGSGRDFAAELTRCGRRACSARVGEVLTSEPPARLQLHLGIGISRGERMDFAIQKSVELGVTAITPLFTERSVVQLDAGRLDRRIAHWQGVVVSACEQSGRSRLPVLRAAAGLADWLKTRDGGLMLDHRAPRSLAALPDPGNALTLLVGPEGGLSGTERELAAAHRFIGVRLGPRVMRTETAPLAALAAIQALWGDFR